MTEPGDTDARFGLAPGVCAFFGIASGIFQSPQATQETRGDWHPVPVRGATRGLPCPGSSQPDRCARGCVSSRTLRVPFRRQAGTGAGRPWARRRAYAGPVRRSRFLSAVFFSGLPTRSRSRSRGELMSRPARGPWTVAFPPREEAGSLWASLRRCWQVLGRKEVLGGRPAPQAQACGRGVDQMVHGAFAAKFPFTWFSRGDGVLPGGMWMRLPSGSPRRPVDGSSPP